MTLRNCHSQTIGNTDHILVMFCVFLLLGAVCEMAYANDGYDIEQGSCLVINPKPFAPVPISGQIRNAYDLYRNEKYSEAAREFQILYNQYPSCFFLFPIIMYYAEVKKCDDAIKLYQLIPSQAGDGPGGLFSNNRRQTSEAVAKNCPHQASAGNRPATLSADSASSTEDPMKPQAKMNNPAPPVPNDHAPIPLALSARSSAVSEPRPWYRKAWPWLTAAGVAVTAAGIGIGIGLGAGQGQGTGIPFSSLYDGAQAVPLARSVH